MPCIILTTLQRVLRAVVPAEVRTVAWLMVCQDLRTWYSIVFGWGWTARLQHALRAGETNVKTCGETRWG